MDCSLRSYAVTIFNGPGGKGCAFASAGDDWTVHYAAGEGAPLRRVCTCDTRERAEELASQLASTERPAA